MKLKLFTIIFGFISLLPICVTLLHHQEMLAFAKPLTVFALAIYFYWLSSDSLKVTDWLVFGMLFFDFLAMFVDTILPDETAIIMVSSMFFIVHIFVFYIFKKEGANSGIHSTKDLLVTLPPAVLGLLFFLVILLPHLPDYFILPTVIFTILLVSLIILAITRPVNSKSYISGIVGIIAIATTDFIWCVDKFIIAIPYGLLFANFLNSLAIYSIALGVYWNKIDVFENQKIKNSYLEDGVSA